jgi:hypothetical protein
MSLGSFGRQTMTLLQSYPCAFKLRIPPHVYGKARSAGILAGDSEKAVGPRCQVYADYLKRHLL